MTGHGSPACFLHELRPDARGGLTPVDPEQWRDVMRWRRAERARLIASRPGLSGKARGAATERIADLLNEWLEEWRNGGAVVSAWLPFRGEPDLGQWCARVAAHGIRTALPVIEAPRQPMVFRLWRPGDPLADGVFGIPVPAGGAPVTPDVVLAPVVGFDAAGFRLGYGGGYFDRTLAAMTPRPRVIGVGFEAARIGTIFPLPHDVAMDVIVTEAGVWTPPA